MIVAVAALVVALAAALAWRSAWAPATGALAGLGIALLGGVAMALLHSLALADAPDRLVFAALIGGDLGPRLLPIGSPAGLLWTHQLRQNGVVVPLPTFVRVGFVVTVPSLVASLAVLWLVT